MKFYPPASIRFFYCYMLMGILVVLPLCLIPSGISVSVPGQEIYPVCVGLFLAIIGTLLFVVAFMEKCFATLRITQSEIVWRCPFRRTLRMKIAECEEIGSYWENKGNGIPKEKIYFSDHKHAKYEINKKGILPMSNHCIKFWYSKQLQQYVLTQLSSRPTGKRQYYRFEFNHDHP